MLNADYLKDTFLKGINFQNIKLRQYVFAKSLKFVPFKIYH